MSSTGEGRTIRNQLQLVVDRFVVPHLEAAAAAVSLELQGEIPTDAAVREAVQKRTLLLEMTPGSPAALGGRRHRRPHARRRQAGVRPAARS